MGWEELSHGWRPRSSSQGEIYLELGKRQVSTLEWVKAIPILNGKSIWNGISISSFLSTMDHFLYNIVHFCVVYRKPGHIKLRAHSQSVFVILTSSPKRPEIGKLNRWKPHLFIWRGFSYLGDIIGGYTVKWSQMGTSVVRRHPTGWEDKKNFIVSYGKSWIFRGDYLQFCVSMNEGRGHFLDDVQ